MHCPPENRPITAKWYLNVFVPYIYILKDCPCEGVQVWIFGIIEAMIRASQVPPRCRPHYVTSRASIRCPLIDAASIRQKKNMYNNMMQMDLSRNDVEVSLALPTRTLNPDEVRQLLKRLYLT